MNAIWQTCTGLLSPLPFWKQTATDTVCCVRSEITHSLSTSSNAYAQTQKQPQATYATTYSFQVRRV